MTGLHGAGGHGGIPEFFFLVMALEKFKFDTTHRDRVGKSIFAQEYRGRGDAIPNTVARGMLDVTYVSWPWSQIIMTS